MSQEEFFMRFQESVMLGFFALYLLVLIGCGSQAADPLAIPDSPDGTVRVVVDGLVQHHPEVVWRALPPTYQQDVVDLSRDFADSIDPAVFDRAVAVARKGVVVLQSKKDIILESATFKKVQVDAETVDAFWEAAVHVLDAVLASDAADLATLREIDVESFLATTGAKIMDHVSELPAENHEMASFAERVGALQKAEIAHMSEEGNHAVVLLTVPGEEPKELQLTRVEDRWIPVELANQWPAMMENTAARIEFMNSDGAARIRVQALFGIGIVEGFIDQIDQMESSDQIDDLIGGVLGNIIATQGGEI